MLQHVEQRNCVETITREVTFFKFPFRMSSLYFSLATFKPLCEIFSAGDVVEVRFGRVQKLSGTCADI